MADIENFPLAVDGSDGPDGSIDGSSAGAAGPSSGGVVLSHSALVAIIVVVVVVAVFGIASSALFFVAKKREWTVRETIRRSARKVVTVLTPRRSEFPKSVKEGRSRLDDVPPTPRIKPEYLDLEKGLDKPKKKRANFSRK
ncbi:hypothetical protein C8A01DRAFT_43918 [Parachaetomium inaequale]|uniref:Uncharacterized protein n=1 Tax=Parachaetomium inaequale TaxID=2588326 RepID=A0AAN6PLT9_9PEZI|nr:hypothetical protein C8A01DRAFT_43918 [Parachaetomium inaequale]